MNSIISEKQEEKINRFFNRKLIAVLTFVLLLLIVGNIIFQLTKHSAFASDNYVLPYPGILPNHRLYPLKALRDNFLEFFTRVPIQKANLYLLFADKRINMAQILARDGEWELAETTASKAEKYLLKVKEWTEKSKAIGSSPEVELKTNISKAGKEHERILNNLVKKSPKAYKTGFKLTQKINQEYWTWAKTQ